MKAALINFKQLKILEGRVQKTKAFKDWVSTLPKKEAKQLSELGLVAWLYGPKKGDDE